MCVVDLGAPPRRQRRQHQRAAGAHVQRPHAGAVQRRRADDDGRRAGGDDVCSHLTQLAHVEQTVLVHPLLDDAYALALRQEGGQRRVQVCRKPRIRHRLRLHAAEGAAGAADAQRAVAGLDAGAGLSQLVDQGVQVLRRRALDADLAARRRRREGEEARLQPVRYDAMAHAAQLGDAIDRQHAAAGALDLRPHVVEHGDDVDDLRLRGRVDQGRLALSQHGGEDGVHRSHDAGVVEEEAGAAQARLLRRPLGAILLAVALDAGAEAAEALDVGVERPHADDVAARRAAGRLAEATEERPHHEEARPLIDDEIVRRVEALDAGGAHAPEAGALVAHLGAERGEDARHRAHVLDVGDVLQDALLGGEQAGGEGIVSRVLGAADAHSPLEGSSTLNDKPGTGQRPLALDPWRAAGRGSQLFPAGYGRPSGAGNLMATSVAAVRCRPPGKHEIPARLGHAHSRAQEYPTSKMAHVDWQVLLITGPTGAGKTTTARALAALQASPTIHICLDSVRESVRSGFADPLRGWTAEAARQYELALQACASVARLYVSNGFRCVIDDVFIPELSASSLAS